MGYSLLLHTDQARCFDESGREIPRDNSGQDAEANSTEGYSRRRFDLIAHHRGSNKKK